MDYPVIEDTVRPFRIWDPKRGRTCPGCCYKYHENARIGAWIKAKKLPISQSIEVIDVRNGKLIGQYTRRVSSVTFHKERSHVQD